MGEKTSPVLGKHLDEIDPVQRTQLDYEITNLKKAHIDPTPSNLVFLFQHEPICMVSAIYTTASLFGGNTSTGLSRLEFECDNEKAKKVIEDWCSHINVRGETLLSFFTKSYVDSLLYGNFYWRVMKTDTKYKIDLDRIDPTTIREYSDSYRGWTWFVQSATSEISFPNENEFYKWHPMIDAVTLATNLEQQYIYIPARPEFVLWGSFFEMLSPMKGVADIVLQKIWHKIYMRWSANKYITPPMFFRLGERDYEPTEDELEAWLPRIQAVAARANYRGNYIIPGWCKPEVGKSLRENPEDFVTEVSYFDIEIGRGLFFPINLLQARGVELATSKTIDENQLRYIGSLRLKITMLLERFFEDVLLPAHGIKSQVKFNWPPLRTESMAEIAQTIAACATAGVFKEMGEPRDILRVVAPHLSHKYDKDPFKLPEPPGGAFGAFGAKPGAPKPKPAGAKPAAAKKPTGGVKHKEDNPEGSEPSGA